VLGAIFRNGGVARVAERGDVFQTVGVFSGAAMHSHHVMADPGGLNVSHFGPIAPIIYLVLSFDSSVQDISDVGLGITVVYLCKEFVPRKIRQTKNGQIDGRAKRTLQHVLLSRQTRQPRPSWPALPRVAQLQLLNLALK